MKLFYLKSVLILLSLTFIFASCEQEDLDPITESLTTVSTQTSGSVDGYRINTQPIQELVALSENMEDMYMNENLLLISESVKTLVMSEENYYSFIIREAKKSPVTSVSLESFIAEFPEVSNRIDQFMEDRGTTLENVIENMNYEGIHYNPVFNIPNAKSLNPSLTPIFSSNLAVSADEDESLEDFIMGWYIDKNNVEYEIVVGETHVEEATPLIVLSIVSDADINIGNDKNIEIITGYSSSLVDPNPEEKISNKLYSYQYRLDERFESSGKSEFHFKVLGLMPNGLTAFGAGGDNNSVGRIAQVDRNDIGNHTTLSKWKYWLNQPASGTQLVFNTYEKDWNHTPKTLGKIWKVDGRTVMMVGARKYNSDCYWNTDIANNDNSSFSTLIDYNYIFSNWAKTYWGDNGTIRLWKVVN